MDYSQIDLAEAIRNRDETAYGYMINKYAKIIYCLAQNILGEVSSKEDIEECVADVFFDAWVKIGQYDQEKGNFRTWLLILTKYKALSYRRKKDASNVVDITDIEVRDSMNLENQVFLRQDQEKVVSIINSFQKTDREIFYRRFFFNEKISDLAEGFNLSRTAIDNRLSRGRKTIKEGLNCE